MGTGRSKSASSSSSAAAPAAVPPPPPPEPEDVAASSVPGSSSSQQNQNQNQNQNQQQQQHQRQQPDAQESVEVVEDVDQASEEEATAQADKKGEQAKSVNDASSSTAAVPEADDFVYDPEAVYPDDSGAFDVPTYEEYYSSTGTSNEDKDPTITRAPDPETLAKGVTGMPRIPPRQPGEAPGDDSDGEEDDDDDDDEEEDDEKYSERTVEDSDQESAAAAGGGGGEGER